LLVVSSMMLPLSTRACLLLLSGRESHHRRGCASPPRAAQHVRVLAAEPGWFHSGRATRPQSRSSLRQVEHLTRATDGQSLSPLLRSSSLDGSPPPPPPPPPCRLLQLTTPLGSDPCIAHACSHIRAGQLDSKARQTVCSKCLVLLVLCTAHCGPSARETE
jgi:hypothetical protein